jgi:hypothetical protein
MELIAVRGPCRGLEEVRFGLGPMLVSCRGLKLLLFPSTLVSIHGNGIDSGGGSFGPISRVGHPDYPTRTAGIYCKAKHMRTHELNLSRTVPSLQRHLTSLFVSALIHHQLAHHRGLHSHIFVPPRCPTLVDRFVLRLLRLLFPVHPMVSCTKETSRISTD